MAVREGKWRCPNCKQVNRGRELNCQGCGGIRGEVKFFLDDDAPEVSDSAINQRAHDGPDWICGFCQTSNIHSSAACKQCSGERSDGVKRGVREKVSAREDDKETDQRKSAGGSGPGETPGGEFSVPVAAIPAGFGKGCCGCLTIFAFLLFLSMGYDWLFSSSEETEVTGRAWNRTLNLEECAEQPWEGWQKYQPPNTKVARWQSRVSGYSQTVIGHDEVPESYEEREQTGTRTVQHKVKKKIQTGTRKVKTGVRDLGNGFFEDVYKDVPEYGFNEETVENQEPVFRTVKRTRIVKKPIYRKDPIYETWGWGSETFWKKAPRKVVSGTFEEPFWPTVEVVPPQKMKLGALREAGRLEEYNAQLKGLKTGQIHDVTHIDSKPLDLELFRQMKLGSRWLLKLGGLGSINSVAPLK